ncbi:dihydroorotate dehydrogenase domain protein, putative [Acidithiobacillus ferrooxidans ATCC 23270]|uniref:Dihydroorotate dehydrogenase domain protein, putative n=2 Tax=Acidithiobacillus ferrooxidans TaxID=920 RepID=B7J892_ACIF2|nr:dihydroorotate dehydrogenase domain protein, putative [Acidithiobacillus ferrooxidans ATCC 23270]
MGTFVISDERISDAVRGNLEVLRRYLPDMDDGQIVETALLRMQMQVVASTPNTTGRYRNILEVFQDFGI